MSSICGSYLVPFLIYSLFGIFQDLPVLYPVP